jgi:DNA-binding YbaB/EbfC family protein
MILGRKLSPIALNRFKILKTQTLRTKDMMKGGMGNMMKQAQQMQANMQKAQAELANIDVEGVASNGLVKVTMACNNVVKRVTLDDSVMDDKETLEDLLVIALKDATAKAEATSSARMANYMPAGMKMPF